jgi:hypothetical protein
MELNVSRDLGLGQQLKMDVRIWNGFIWLRIETNV